MKLLLGLLLCWPVQFLFQACAAAQPLQKVRVGYPSISSRQAQLWVAKEEGIFRKYGLDVELIFLRGGQVAIQALTGGDPPLMTVGNVIIANLQGHDIVLVGAVENSYDQSVMARPGVMTRVEQLKGKRFGISGFGSATHNAALILFKKYNLEANKDVTFVSTGTGPERLAAMGAGRIDATFFNPSEVPQAVKAGVVGVLSMADLGFEGQGGGLADSARFIQNRPRTRKAGRQGARDRIQSGNGRVVQAQRGQGRCQRQSHISEGRPIRKRFLAGDGDFDVFAARYQSQASSENPRSQARDPHCLQHLHDGGMAS